MHPWYILSISRSCAEAENGSGSEVFLAKFEGIFYHHVPSGLFQHSYHVLLMPKTQTAVPNTPMSAEEWSKGHGLLSDRDRLDETLKDYMFVSVSGGMFSDYNYIHFLVCSAFCLTTCDTWLPSESG